MGTIRLLHSALMALSVLLGVASVATFTSCKDDELKKIQGEVEVPEDTDLMELEQYSYTIPLEIKSDSEWEVEFVFDDQYICYAFPEKGNGNATVQLCVLDNWNDERRTGEMHINFLKDPSKNQVIPLRQKGNMDSDVNITDVTKGDRIYAVGYGYNYLGEYASANSVSRNPIIRIAECKDRVSTGGVNASYVAKTYSGSSVTELTNSLSTDAKFGGKYLGFKGEIGATFGKKDFSNNSNEYAISYIEVAQQNVYLEVNRQEIIKDYMTDAAYEAINGLDHESKRGTTKTVYTADGVGFARLVKDYGTHLLVNARLGGRLKYRMTVDVSKVEGSYDLNAYANCSYSNAFVNASANVSDSLRNSYKRNASACDITVLVQGGSQSTALALGGNGGDTEKNIEAWRKSLAETENQTLVGLDVDGMIPLYELVDTDLPGGELRREMLKDYLTGGSNAVGNLEDACSAALGIDMSYISSDAYVISQFQEWGSHSSATGDSNGTWVQDYYEGNRGNIHVAQVCCEYIPVIDKSEPVFVIYPVLSNKVKYNMGLFLGNNYRKPAKVCWDGNSVSVTEHPDFDKKGSTGMLTLRGSSFSAYKEEDPLEFDTYLRPSFLTARKHDNPSYKYPLVKIFNNLWTREDYQSECSANGEYAFGTANYNSDDRGSIIFVDYEAATNPNYPPYGWRIPKAEDYNIIKSTLVANGISQVGMAFLKSGVLGYNAELKGWLEGYLLNKDELTKYITSDNYHVTIRKDGGFGVEKAPQGRYRMSVRLIKQ